MADYTATELESWAYLQYPKMFRSSRTNNYLKNEFGDLIRDQKGQKIITHKIRKTSDYAEMSDKAKTLYMILFDRLCISFKTNKALLDAGVSKARLDFLDETGATYIVFTNKDLMDAMDIKSENTIIKAKRELAKHGLLREQQLGMNKPNRLYPQKLEGSRQFTEWRDLETDEITDKFDHNGVRFYHVEKAVESLQLTGTVKNEAPKNAVQEPQKVQSIKPNHYLPENLDTNQYSPENYFRSGGNHEFLTEKSVFELSLWGMNDAQELQDIIFKTKRIVEQKYQEILKANNQERISGELWAEDLEFEILKFGKAWHTLDKKTGNKKLDNPKGFFTTMMQKFWLAALAIQLSKNQEDEIPMAKAYFAGKGQTLLQGFFKKYDTKLLEKIIAQAANSDPTEFGLTTIDLMSWVDGMLIWSV
jgi:transposase